ncbi:MAG TPA: FecR domain-containing protein [Chthoniobacterales bacterium]|nr:FecR domain-containing protein [Chthoniobacterales bacterium]
MAVRTGTESRAELTFTDLTVTRLGANTVFSMNGNARELDLASGSVLLEVPPKSAAATIKSQVATAAVQGGTALFGTGPPTKFLILEGIGTFYPTGHPGEAVTLHGGEMVMLTADGHITQPEKFDVKNVVETSALIVDFPDLANLPLILQVIDQQTTQSSPGASPPPTKDIVDIISQNIVSNPGASPPPPPTPFATPSEFGPPSTITSPDPYLISSRTQIQTDPSITTNGTTNGVTDFGKLYRGTALDGTPSEYLFGEAPTSFDQMVFSGLQNNLPVAVFKFSDLELTGNPTIIVPSGGATHLALVAVGTITSGGPGGTLTFTGIPRLDFITQDGSINLGSQISFSGIDHLSFYARGSSSNLTLASPISGGSVVDLYSGGTVQVNGNITVTDQFSSLSGGDFLAGSGVITATNVDIESLSNINIDGSKFPNPPDNSGSFVLNAANTLNVAVTGGGQPFGWDTLTATATTINLTSSTPTTLDFSNSSSVTFTAGSGGINAPNIDFIAGDLTLTSGGDISVHGLDVVNNTLSNTATATGSFTAASNVRISTLMAGTFISIGGNALVSNMTAGSTIDVTGQLGAFGTVAAGGNITANGVDVENINAPNGVLTVGSNGITAFVVSPGGATVQETFNINSIISPVGIDYSGNQFNGIDGHSSGGLLTINATTLTFDSATGIGNTNFNGADAGSFSGGGPTNGGDGGTFIVNTTGDITANHGADITATTGLNTAAGVYSGAGGSVTLLSTGGMVTVNDTIQVSSDDSAAPRQSASGGTIDLQSNLTTGTGITVGANGQLLSLVNANAPGPGGSITLSTKGADIIVNGTIEADRGTITMDQNDPVGPTPVITIDGATLTSGTLNITGAGDVNIGLSNPVTMTVANDATVQILGSGAASAAIDFNGGSYNVGGTFLSTIAGDGAITFSNATVRADIVKVGVFGTNGTLTIGGGSISANTLLQLYAPGSNGSIDFISNVTLSNQSSAVVIAANKVTIFNGVVVTIGGSTDPASVFTNIANYTGFGGNGSTTGTFAGNGATTQPLSSAPPFGSGGGPSVTTITYLGAPAGNWSDPTSWNPNTVPNNSGGNLYNAVQSAGTLTQDIVSGVTIQQFQMSGGTLQLTNPLTLNAGLQFSGGTIQGGNLFTAGTSNQSALMTVNGTTISNSGTYNVSFDGSNVFSGSATFNNSGTLSKTTGTGTDNFNIPLNNSGTVSSENGTLLFSVGGTSAGTFSAAAGATVEFASNWTFTNGTHFSGAGTIQLDNNTTTNLSGTITNSGTILVNAGANNADLRIADGTMLTGGGNVILSENGNARIFGTANTGTETLTNVNNTISGAGQIGAGNLIEFINQSAGVIDATSSTNALIITPTNDSTLVSANGGGFVNQGLLEATAAGGLVLSGGQFNNNGATIEAIGSGNNVYLENSVTISGGTLSDSGGGLIETAAGHAATLDGTSQGALTVAGTYQVTNNSTTFLKGTITNTGTISINAGANNADLRIADGTMLTGGGNVILSDSPNARIWGTANNGTETLTNVNNTISGAGQIGAGNLIEFINQSAGVIDATSATNALIITPTTQSAVVNPNGGGFVNQGLLEATAAGGLVLNGGQFNNKAAMIEAVGSGNNVTLENSVTISGGTLSGSGLFQTAAGHAATLDGTSQGALTIAGTYQVTNNSTTFLNGTITNTGTISINAGANTADLRIADGTMLTGGGNVILSDSPNNRIWGTANTGTETLTNVNNTISGAGQIGVSNSIEFINQSAGVIDATSATNALIITPTTQSAVVNPNGGGFVNQGLLEATAAGGLVLNGGQFNNTGGVILSDGITSQVQLINNVSVTGGTLRTTNAGNFSIAGNAAVDQITGTSGTITVTAAGALSAVNGINFNGVNGGPGGTLSLSAPSVTFGSAASQINGALLNGGDATGPSSPGGNGGTFSVTATSGDITVGSDIEASTGANGSSVSTGGTGGTVNLTANSGQITVNNRIQVSHDAGSRKSAAGGNINITSGKTSGVAIDLASGAQLLALLDAAAPGPGGKIAIMATSPTNNTSSVNIDGTVQADRGTVDIEHAGDNGQVNLSSADVRADIVKIGAFGTNGQLIIGGGAISADSLLKLYAPSSNGTLDFVANVTLSSGTEMDLAANTITINSGVTVTIAGAGGAANIYTNSANYSGFGGSNPSNGTFAGNGAKNPQPLASAPTFGTAPSSFSSSGTTGISNQTLSSRSISPSVNTAGSAISVSNSGQLLSLLNASTPPQGGKIIVSSTATRSSTAAKPTARLAPDGGGKSAPSSSGTRQFSATVTALARTQ